MRQSNCLLVLYSYFSLTSLVRYLRLTADPFQLPTVRRWYSITLLRSTSGSIMESELIENRWKTTMETLKGPAESLQRCDAHSPYLRVSSVNS